MLVHRAVYIAALGFLVGGQIADFTIGHRLHVSYAVAGILFGLAGILGERFKKGVTP